MKTAVKKTKIVGVKELRTNLDKYITEVSAGKSFTVVRRSEPVFKISPPAEEELWETVIDFTELNENGISAKELLKRLKRFHG